MPIQLRRFSYNTHCSCLKETNQSIVYNSIKISQDRLTGKRHKNIFNDVHPDSTSGIQLVYCSFMEFVQVQIINSFLCCNQQMLIPCIWMNPTCGTMYSQWTAVEYLLMFATKITNILLIAIE